MHRVVCLNMFIYADVCVYRSLCLSMPLHMAIYMYSAVCARAHPSSTICICIGIHVSLHRYVLISRYIYMYRARSLDVYH